MTGTGGAGPSSTSQAGGGGGYAGAGGTLTGDATRQPQQTQQFPPRSVMPPQQSAMPADLHSGGGSAYEPPVSLPDGVGKFGGVPIGLGGAGEVSRLGPRGSSESTLPRIGSDTQLSGRPRSGGRPGSASKGRASKAQPR